jgi:hypothetical protein
MFNLELMSRAIRSVLHNLVHFDLLVAVAGSSQLFSSIRTMKTCFQNLDAHLGKDQHCPNSLSNQTVELSKLQVGPTGPIRLIASTVAEIEYLLPWLIQAQREGRGINVRHP